MQNQTQQINFEKLIDIYKVDQKFWDGELSLSACPGAVSRPPRTKKTANPGGIRAVAW